MPLTHKLEGLENSPSSTMQAEAPADQEVCQRGLDPSEGVTHLVARPVENESPDSSAAPASSEGKSSVAMQIVTEGLQFKLDTVVDQSQQSVELAAKLELALALLDKSERKLAQAMTEIGQLQAQMELQTQVHKEMQKQLQMQVHKEMQKQLQMQVHKEMQKQLREAGANTDEC